MVTGIPGKTGIVYTLDRQTGEFLWARRPCAKTWSPKIDGATGEVTVNPETTSPKWATTLHLSHRQWRQGFPAGAYSPLTHAMYFPLQNTCGTVTALDKALVRHSKASQPQHDHAGHRQDRTVQAISVETGRINVENERRAGMMSLVATGGGLVFGGDTNGHFLALDQETGKVLWELNLGSPVTGYPISYAVTASSTWP